MISDSFHTVAYVFVLLCISALLVGGALYPNYQYVSWFTAGGISFALATYTLIVFLNKRRGL